MAALIEFVCITGHEQRGDPAITLEQRAWAYCAAGGADGHTWARIDPTPVETLRSRSGNGRSHLSSEQIDESSLAHGPGR
jgi:hypothetical protein